MLYFIGFIVEWYYVWNPSFILVFLVWPTLSLKYVLAANYRTARFNIQSVQHSIARVQSQFTQKPNEII